MTWRIDFDSLTASAIVSRGVDDDRNPAWNELVQAAIAIDGNASISVRQMRLAWSRFLALARTLAYLRRRDGVVIEYADEARDRLSSFSYEARVVSALRATQGPVNVVSSDEIVDRLRTRGWDFDKRNLTDAQFRDLAHALALTHGANFSVPGAGKTTVALAVHLLSVPPETRLIVVAPKNAFPAWDEVLQDCLRDPAPMFTRLVGGRAAIRLALTTDPAFAIIGYGQLVRVLDEVLYALVSRPAHVILDESHRIKAGTGTQTGSAALTIGPFAVRRDILSGTPLPNANSDLAPQFEFLWPGQSIGAQLTTTPPRDVIQGLYVRTTKGELGLPSPVVDYQTTDMSDPQRLLYGVLRNDLLRQLGAARGAIAPGARTSVMRLLQAAIDPQAAATSIIEAGDAGPPASDIAIVCQLVLEERLSPRLDAVIRKTRDLASEGRKVVVWAPFIATIERLVEELDDLGAVAIHGGVPAGSEEDDDTREGIVRRFHDDQSCLVLAANPAAGGEGISLHRVCHDAIYVGRTYNAAHYLQSRDRIHRLGLDPEITTRITLFESTAPGGVGSIDMSVRRRLDSKITQMSQALEDWDLRQLALESDTAEAYLDDGLTFDDLTDLLRELTGNADGG
jgi:hypothetical protein